MSTNEFYQERQRIYAHARSIRESGPYADKDDAANNYLSYALDRLNDEYYHY